MFMGNILSFDVTNMIWPWLFPVTYLLHIAEEYCGGDGYSAYLSRTKGVDLTTRRFFLMTGTGLVLMIAGFPLAYTFRFPQLLMVILGTVFLVNGLSHTISGVLTTRYNPGLLTGMLIWIPLGVATLIHLKKHMHPNRYWVAMAVGVGINVIVLVIARGGRRLFEG